MKRPVYSKTKPSGVEWLGDEPGHWEVRRLRFSVRSNPVKSELAGVSGDTEVSFVPMDAVGEYGGMNLEKEKLLNEVYTGYTYFADGDVVIAKITPCFENGKGAIAEGLKNGIGFGTTEFHVLRAEEQCDRRFLFYLTISHPFRKIGASEMLGAGGQKRVPEDFIKNLRIGIPPIFEQRTIAEFLDRKTGQIDELIGKKKELIEKLTEQRSALITAAVTGKIPEARGQKTEVGGQKAAVGMKDSGIAWLGKIPEHWGVRRLKFSVSKVGSGVTPKGGASVYQSSGIPLLRSQNIHFDGLRLDDVAYVDESVHESMENSKVLAGDVLLNITGASIGRCYFFDGTLGEANVNQHVCIIRPEPGLLTRFLHYALTLPKGMSERTLKQALRKEMAIIIEAEIPGVKETNASKEAELETQ